MKLALIRQRYTPFGGAERFMDRAIHALGNDADITVFAREWRGEAAGYRFVECNPPHRSNVQRERGFAGAVRAALRAQSFDLVQSHERIVPEGIAAPFLYRAGDGVHATWLRERARAQGVLGSLRNAINPYHRFMVALERGMFTHAHLAGVICNSRMVRDDIATRFALPASKLHVIYNGVDLEQFHPRLRDASSRAGALRQSLPEHIDTRPETVGGSGSSPLFPLLLHVGSGFERKGVANLLTAFARVKSAATLVIAGEDKHAARYQRLATQLNIAGRVRFTGALPDVKPLYAAADAFVLPTLYDPMPNAALEALACGLPVLTTTTCGAAEFITEGVNGYVRDALDIDGLAQALALLSDPARAASMRGAARASVAHLSLDAMAQQLLSLYRSLTPRG
jgi:UDP-glucose:(heptosyl)LPS alpha-1,3-glucosyltransferase